MDRLFDLFVKIINVNMFNKKRVIAGFVFNVLYVCLLKSLMLMNYTKKRFMRIIINHKIATKPDNVRGCPKHEVTNWTGLGTI